MEIYKLTNETIDMLSDRLSELYLSNGSDRKEATRARLLLEEALLKYQNHFGPEIEVYFRIYHILAQTRFCVRLRAPSYDPFSLEENPMAFMIKSIRSSFEGNIPSWRYRNLENELVFSLRKKAKQDALTKLLIPVLGALVLGFAARLLLPHAGLTTFVNDYLEPLSNAYAGLFCVMAVVISLCGFILSIVNIGDMASVSAFGGHILRRFYLMTTAIIVFFTVPVLPFFDLSGSGNFTLAAKSIYDILISFIPSNFIAPFLNFNSLHIMIVGLMFGFSLLAMGQKGETLVRLFDECNMVAMLTNGFLDRFIGIYAGLKFFAIVTTSEIIRLAGTGKMLLSIICGELLIFVFYTIYASVKTKTPVKDYLHTMMPPFIVCLSSANLGTAYNTMLSAVQALGVDEDTFTISSSLGSVVFQPACTLVFVLSSLFMSASFGVEISLTWVLMCVILSIILIAAVPNIPGAAISVFTLLYSQLGLPAEALSLMIAINALLQFLTVAVDAWCLQSEIICIHHDRQQKQVNS